MESTTRSDGKQINDWSLDPDLQRVSTWVPAREDEFGSDTEGTTDVEFAQWQVNRYSFPYRSRGNFWLTVPSRISGETGQNE